MTLNEISQWFGIIAALVTGIWSLFLHFRKKCYLQMDVSIRQFDHSKGLNASIHPVNELVVSIVNTSNLPLTIRSINFVYFTKTVQAKLTYDNFSHKKRSPVEGKTLLKSQEASFSLSYNKGPENKVIDELENIILISSFGHQYKLGIAKLRAAIEQVKLLPPPHPDNLGLNFEK